LVLGLQLSRKIFPGITALLSGAVLAVLAVAALIAVYYVVRSRADIIRYLLRPPVLLAGVYLGLYLCGLIYAGRTTVISFDDPRMLYPICPIALLLLGGVSSNLPEWSSAVPSRRFGYTLLAVGVVCYSLLHSRNMVTLRPANFHLIRRATSEPIGDSGSLGDWLRAHTPAHQPIMAGDGQACGYLTRRETISLVSTCYSSATWTEDRIRKTAERYGASVLILFPNGDSSRQVAAESPFINDLLQAALPPWIILETQSRDIKIYRLLRRPGATGGSS